MEQGPVTTKKRLFNLLRGFVTGLGVILLTLALTAGITGIDKDGVWDISRQLALLTGVILAWPLLGWIYIQAKHRILQPALGALPPRPRRVFGGRLIDQMGAIQRLASRAKRSNAYQRISGLLPGIAIAAIILFVAATYLWLASVGKWVPLKETTRYYDQMAEAFLAGKPYLLDQPHGDLLELDDPYDLAQRQGVPYIWDSLLYRGRYYLYWGPVPGALIAGAKLITSAMIGDQLPVLVFALGAFFFSIKLVLHLWQSYFRDIPFALVFPGLLVVGLVNPLPWLLGRPEVYEAAIAAGQFFFVGGLYWGFTAVSAVPVRRWRLAFAGLFLAFALGSRWNLAPAAIAVAAVIGQRASMARRSSSKQWLNWLSLGLPMAGVTMALALYNQARFDRIFELGLKYQLGQLNLIGTSEAVFDVRRLVPNLYNYLVMPFRRLEVFPYVKPQWGIEYSPPIIGGSVGTYRTEQITGIVVAAPYLLFAIAAMRQAIGLKLRDLGFVESRADFRISNGAVWIVLTLIVVATLISLPIMLYLWATMRFMADFVIPIAILAAVGVWLIFHALGRRRWLQRFYVLLVWGLALYTSAIGMLLAVTGYSMRFERLNPVLFDDLTRLLTW